MLAPPPDALTAEGYDMTFGTSVLGWLIYTVPQAQQTYLDIPNYRTLLLHGITSSCVVQSFYPRTQIPGCQPLLANGNNRRLCFRFWARFFNLQRLADEEKDVCHGVVRPKQTGQLIRGFVTLIEFAQPQWSRETLFTPKSLPDGMAIRSSLFRFTQVRFKLNLVACTD